MRIIILPTPYTTAQTAGRSRQISRINSPLRSIFVKLVPRISPPLLNCFPRFQWHCNLLTNAFPTMYNITQYSEGTLGKSKQKNGKFHFSPPRADMEMEITLLESPELTGFYEIFTTNLEYLLKSKCYPSQLQYNPS